MLLSPHLPIHRSRFQKFWDTALEAMRFEGLQLLCQASTRRRMRRWHSLSFLQWYLNGRDTQLAIMARYAAAAKLPRELLSFLDTHTVRVIIVHHCFQMEVAKAICDYLKRHRRPQPMVVLETHDVQANLYAEGGIQNVYLGRTDDLGDLRRDELRLAEFADRITYVTDEDMLHFSAKLNAKHHLVLATLDPARERELLAASELPDESSTRHVDFLYVGNNNPGNERSIVWFLSAVVPLLGESYSIAIVGSIARHLKASNLDLFNRFERYFVGEVADVVTYYRRALVVIAPVTFGTGTSIKTIEALAAGKPIVGTSGAFRGLPKAAMSAAVRASDDPAGFAQSMVDVHRHARELSGLSRKLYLENFSNTRYFDRWDGVLSDSHVTADPHQPFVFGA